MKYHWSLIILFLVVLQPDRSDAFGRVWESIYRFPKNKTKVGITVARSECSRLGPSFDLPDDQSHRELLRQAMKDMAVAPAWLALRKTTYDRWTWVNGTAAKPATIRDGAETEMCGAISLQERNIVPSNCNDERNGFVCEIKGSRGCTLKYFTQACVQVKSKTYIIGCQVESWYKARELCQQYGADLANIESGETLTRILKYITDGQFAGVCSWLFLGLSKEDWKIHKNSGDSVPRFVNWTSAEPRQDSMLVQLAFSGDTYSWKSVRSDLTAVVVCKDYSRQYAVVQTIPVSQQQEGKTITEKAPVWIFAVTAVVSIAVTLLVIGLVWYLQKRLAMPKKKTDSANEEDGQKDAREMKAVDRGEDTGAQEKAGLLEEKKSSSVEQATQEEMLGIQEEHVKYLLGESIRIGMFVDTSKTVMESEEQEEAQKTLASYVNLEFSRVMKNTKSKMRVLNLKKLVNSTLEDSALSVIKEINTLVERYQLDAVYLPEMEAPEVGKDETLLIEAIHDLRKKTVLVSAADKNKNEFPACEVLCIGLLDYLEKPQIAAGILDLWVSLSKAPLAEREVVGKARGLAFVSAILDMAKNKDKKIYDFLRNTGNIRKFIIDFFSFKSHDNYGFGELTFDQDCVKKISEGIENFQSHLSEPETVRDDPYLPLTRVALKNVFAEWEGKKTLANVKGDITIVVAATPVSSEDIDISGGPSVKEFTKGKYADIKKKEEHRDTVGTQFVQSLVRTFSAVKGGKESTNIKIIFVQIKESEMMVKLKWDVYSKKLQEILDLEPDIVYISASGNIPDRGHGIKTTLLTLSKSSVIITGAKTHESRKAPPAFPGESVICAGREGGPSGSVLDFVSDTEQTSQGSTDESWLAAAETVCVAAAVLLKAKVLDINPENYEKLKTTAVMHNILARMCSHYPEHRYKDGYGTLVPTKLLKEEANEEFEKLIYELTGKNAATCYWSGKTIN